MICDWQMLILNFLRKVHIVVNYDTVNIQKRICVYHPNAKTQSCSTLCWPFLDSKYLEYASPVM